MNLGNSKLYHHIITEESGRITFQNRASMSAFAHIRPDYIQHLNEKLTVQIDRAVASPDVFHIFSVLVKETNYTFEVAKQDRHLNFIGIVSLDNLEFSETHYRLLMQTMRQVNHHISHDLTHPSALMKGLLNIAINEHTVDEVKKYLGMIVEQQEKLDEEILKLAKFVR